MTEKEVKDYIGAKNWESFVDWMGGQTVSRLPNGEINFYKNDVEAFKRKLETGYDRQKDPAGWD